ncbi:hypothetical protein K1T71_009161 [Dendrolimus kikuchii]|uniref:Uncharacterized protein n=1 Tax=Dendrolimus kikuchii TaxID=765133 RepID=A0ACC1CTS2_9NEOP|nr:hypothetical protein K1T71_009161 [Dendrolimus kikuchii]
MARSLKLLILFVGGVMASSFCERYEFEDSFENNFSNTKGVCIGIAMWNHREYANIDLWSPFNRSTSYITPLTSLSCVSSYTFPMTTGGILEVNIYMDSVARSDQITILANQEVIGGNDAVVGTISNTPQDAAFVSGWHTLRITLIGGGTYGGYISLMGMASSESTVLVDSFRYIPPNTDEADCMLYDVSDTTTTTIETTMPTTEPTTTTINNTEPTTTTTEPTTTTTNTEPTTTTTEPTTTTTNTEPTTTTTEPTTTTTNTEPTTTTTEPTTTTTNTEPTTTTTEPTTTTTNTEPTTTTTEPTTTTTNTEPTTATTEPSTKSGSTLVAPLVLRIFIGNMNPFPSGRPSICVLNSCNKQNFANRVLTSGKAIYRVFGIIAWYCNNGIASIVAFGTNGLGS